MRPGVLFLYLAAHRNLLIFFHVKSPFLKSLIPFEKVLLFQTPVPIIRDMRRNRKRCSGKGRFVNKTIECTLCEHSIVMNQKIFEK